MRKPEVPQQTDSAMHTGAVDGDSGPGISVHWHKRLWGDRCGDAMVEILVADPRIAQALDDICLDDVGAAGEGLEAKTCKVLLAVHADANADYLLGVARYAKAWAAEMFGNGSKLSPDDLPVEVLREGLELATQATDIDVILSDGAVSHLSELSQAGACVIAGWIAGQTASVAASLRLRFPPDDAVLSPTEILEPRACTRLMFAFAEMASNEMRDGV